MSLLTLDQNLTESLYRLTRDSSANQHLAYVIATYLIYLLPIVLLVLFWRQQTRVESAKLFVMTLVTWQGLNKLLGDFLYGHYGFRDRPFASHGLSELLFEQPQKAFPSDHAAVFMFVTLALYYYGHKKWAAVFLVAMILSSVARVAIGFHWAGDIVGGWAVGAIGFGLMVWLDPALQKIGDWFFGLFNRSKQNEPRGA